MGNLRDKYTEKEWDEITKDAKRRNESRREALENDLIALEAPVGALILSPTQSIHENVKLFNNWLRETYKD